jgi:hypothetical protein
MGAYIIGMDNPFPIGSPDLSFAPFRQWNKCIVKVMVGAEFDFL